LPSDSPIIGSVAIDGNSVTLNLTEPGSGYGFSIDQPDGPFQSGNYFIGVQCGPHTAYVDAGNGCGTTSFQFEQMGIPAYFSPNGDGYADRWNILCGQNRPNTILYIFDRFGKLIKQISAAGVGWDGIYNGQPMPSDDYWFIMNSEDGVTTKGHFALKR
jgi:trimeric autotransporter adhesin